MSTEYTEVWTTVQVEPGMYAAENVLTRALDDRTFHVLRDCWDRCDELNDLEASRG